METLEHALEELRRWSEPGRRAELIATAWRRGETNVSSLAEVARVTRQTVYTDLKSCGIDPHDERGAREPAWLEPFHPGLTASAETEEEAWKLLIGLVNRSAEKAGAAPLPTDYQPPNPPTDQIDVFLSSTIRQWRYSRYHQAILPTLREEYECRQRTARVRQRAESKWEALRTAENWTAAHHQWVEAVDEARQAIAAWVSAAEARYALESDPPVAAFRSGGQDGMPKDLLVPAVDVDKAKLAATDLEETYRSRLELTSATLNARQP